jgi:hypothetical protein
LETYVPPLPEPEPEPTPVSTEITDDDIPF